MRTVYVYLQKAAAPKGAAKFFYGAAAYCSYIKTALRICEKFNNFFCFTY